MKKILVITYALFFVLSLSCSHPQPLKNEIEGIWISEDGAEIELKADGSVNVTKIPLNLVNSDLESSFSGSGKWYIAKSESVSPWWVIEVNSKDNILTTKKNDGFSIELLVSRSGLGGGNSKIISLFMWKGDPDLDDRYELKKVNDVSDRSNL